MNELFLYISNIEEPNVGPTINYFIFRQCLIAYCPLNQAYYVITNDN